MSKTMCWCCSNQTTRCFSHKNHEQWRNVLAHRNHDFLLTTVEIIPSSFSIVVPNCASCDNMYLLLASHRPGCSWGNTNARDEYHEDLPCPSIPKYIILLVDCKIVRCCNQFGGQTINNHAVFQWLWSGCNGTIPSLSAYTSTCCSTPPASAQDVSAHAGSPAKQHIVVVWPHHRSFINNVSVFVC